MAIILIILFVPTLILYAIGNTFKVNNNEKAKVFYVLAVLYLIIGLGICGSIINL